MACCSGESVLDTLAAVAEDRRCLSGCIPGHPAVCMVQPSDDRCKQVCWP